MYLEANDMAVVACSGDGGVSLERRPVPQPAAGEMVLGLKVIGLCGTDIFKLDTNSAPAGLVLGHELVGEVLSLGDGVKNFALGDRIAVPHHVACGECALCRRGNETLCGTFRENLMDPGGFAEKVLIRERAVRHAAFKLPQGLSDASAVFVEPAACVLRGIDRSGLTGEGLAVVMGAGSMGFLHLLLLKAVFPDLETLLIDPLPDRRELALKLGAGSVAPPGELAFDETQRLSDGLGADAVFDTVGRQEVLDQGLAVSRQGGSVVLFAHGGEGARASFEFNDLFKYERRILGSYSGSLHEQRRVFDLMVQGRFDPSPLASHLLPLDRFEEGLSLARKQQALKVLFTPLDRSEAAQ